MAGRSLLATDWSCLSVTILVEEVALSIRISEHRTRGTTRMRPEGVISFHLVTVLFRLNCLRLRRNSCNMTSLVMVCLLLELELMLVGSFGALRSQSASIVMCLICY
jgi:hypothetical protein